MALSRLRCSAIRRAPCLRRTRLITYPSQPHLHSMEIHSVARMSLLRCNPSSEQMLKFCRSEFFPFVNGVHAKSLSNKFPVGIRYYSSSDAPEHAVLHMPALSPTMSQGNIAKWRKKVGDKIGVGDVLCEIETDKATLEFESLEEGFLGAILVPEGSKDIAVGHPIAITVEDPDDLEKVSKIHIGSETKHETFSGKSTTSSEQANKPTSPKTSLSELPQHIVLVMPALSPTMNQGNLTKWCKKEGDKIDVGDIICEIETDKATLEYESLEEGFLAKILVPEGSKEVAVGQPIAITVEDPEDLEAIRTSDVGHLKSSPDTTIQQSVVIDAKTQGVKYNRISPSALLLLKEHGLDASSITASGPRGTMLKGDVLAAIKSQKGAAKVPHSDDEISSRPIQSQTTSMPKSTVQQTDDYEDLPNTQIRKVIATRLLESKQSIPHLYLSTDVILDPLLAFRKDLKAKHDTKVSVNDIVIKAVAVALRNVPQANAYWDAGKGEIVLCSSVDISVAVATEKGLMTPIVRSADQKSISAISLEIKELAEKARAGKLKPNEFQGGTFSISNLGMFPVDRFCAIINPPQSGILAVGRGNQVVEAVTGEDGIVKPAVVTKMNLTLSADNRVFDGIVGGAFLEALQSNFSDIRRLML